MASIKTYEQWLEDNRATLKISITLDNIIYGIEYEDVDFHACKLVLEAIVKDKYKKYVEAQDGE